MNSYNENLRSSVVTSLYNQEMQKKRLKSDKNASMFSLYYAEGAIITAEEKIKASKVDLKKKANIKVEAVNTNNMSGNVLSAATQGNQYLKQSVTNAAVCAANVQAAATAIVRLAGDMGNVYSIVNASDSETDVFALSKEALDLINDTAYSIEVASQLAMEASVNTARVSGGTIQDKAKATHDLMSSLLKVSSDDYEMASQLVNNDNAAYALASANEKLAESAFVNFSVDYDATIAAYQTMNNDLNMGLTAVPTAQARDKKFTVRFNELKSSFSFSSDPGSPNYLPVQAYYVLAVKDAAKSTFSVAAAQNIVDHGPANQYKAVDPKKITSRNGKYAVDIQVSISDTKANAKSADLLDSDGDPLKQGKDYVVFVFATYVEEYRKKLNCFDDFLSAPSARVGVKIPLTAVPYSGIHIKPIDPADAASTENTDSDDEPVEETHVLTFSVTEDNVDKDHLKYVNYRCMLLPQSLSLNSGLLNKASLASLKSEMLKRLLSIHDSDSSQRQEEDHDADAAQDQEDPAGNKRVTQSAGSAKPTKLKQAAAKTADKKNAAAEETSDATAGGLGFYFVKDLAEQVLPGNYLEPKKGKSDSWEVKIGPETTDNFGNALCDGETYIPLVLSVYDADGPDASSFENSWSGYDKIKSFTYSVAKTKTKSRK